MVRLLTPIVHSEAVRARATLRRTFAAFSIFIASSLGNQAAFAASLPAGRLVDASAVESDDTLVCSSYTNKGKLETYLSRIDGAKLLGKTYWTAKEVRAKITALNLSIKKLKGRSDKISKKQLKKAKEQKLAFATAKLALSRCSGNDPNNQQALVGFPHVEKIIQKQCMVCHGVLAWENTEDFYISTARVTPGNLEASPFYTFISNNPEGYLPAYMPKGGRPLSDINIWLLSRWVLDMANRNNGGPNATPTPGGTLGQGRQEYNTFCSSCHGMIDVSSKWGKTAAQIQAATNSIPQMLHLRNLSNEQLQRITLALSTVQPPLQGTVSVRSLGPVTEGNSAGSHSLQFEVKFTGTAQQAFTVGYVTSSGTALAGSDFVFSVGTLEFQGTNAETKIINVSIIGDTFQESDESLFVDIGGVSYGGVRVNTATASGSILNDDGANQVLPPQSMQVRLAYGFNGNFKDALGLADGIAQGDASISSSAHTGSGALQLDGTGDFVTVPGNNLVNMSSFTAAAWVWWDNSSSTTSRIFDFGSSTSNYIYLTPRDSSGRIRFELRGNTPTTTFLLQGPVNAPLLAGQWQHIAASFNTTTDEMKIFLNGSELVSRTGVTTDLASIFLTDNRIGRSRVGGSTDFQGRVDEVLVWNAALTQAEVAAAKAMTETTRINSGLDVRFSNGQPLLNGSNIDFDSLETGSDETISLFVQNNGPAGLGFTSSPNAQIFGENADEFSIQVQPMPWQQMLGVGSLTSIALRYAPTLPGEKTATLVISNTDLANGNFASTLQAEATGDAIIPENQSGDSDNPSLEQGRMEYAVNCASCHGVLASSQKLGASIEAVTAALNPVSGIAQMRSLGLSTEQVARIVLALNSQLPVVAEAPTVGDSLVNVGTATYVAETLKDIFLPPGDTSSYTTQNSAIWTIIRQGILGLNANGTTISGRVGFFHRRCQRFDDTCIVEQLANLMRPPPDTVRAGLYKRTCDLLTENDLAVSNALGKIGLTTSSIITPQVVKDMYEKLFVPGRQMPQFLADIISTFPQQAPGLTSTDKFRFVLNYLCVSGIAEVI